MKVLYALVFLVGLSLPCKAQSIYDFTLQSKGGSVSGSGSFEVGSWVTLGGTVLYPINSLTGMLNGMSLSLTPGYFIGSQNGPDARFNGNAFYTQNLPVAPAWPLYFQSSTQNFEIWQSDFFQPGVSGQSLLNLTANTTIPVTFSVSPEPQKLLSRTRNPQPPTSPLRFQLPSRTETVSPVSALGRPRVEHNYAIGIDVGAAIAGGFLMYEIVKHHRQHREAYPTGRIY